MEIKNRDSQKKYHSLLKSSNTNFYLILNL